MAQNVKETTSRDDFRVMLLYPPITDPTAPYHSLVYLASYAKARGFRDIEVRDTNIEALQHLAQPEVMEGLLEEWAARRRALGSQARLSRFQQLEFEQLTRAAALQPGHPSQAIAALRDPEIFYDFAAYRHAVHTIQTWLQALSCDGFPAQYGRDFRLVAPGLFNLSSVGDLASKSVLDRVVGPFALYYRQRLLPELRHGRFRFVGINITYTSQLPFALWLLREIRAALPGCCLVCGGTAATWVWKCISDRRLLVDLYQGANACVIGEGETAFVQMLEDVRAGKLPGKAPNTLTLHPDPAECSFQPAIRYENLNELPTPDYSLMRQDLYFSPHPLVYYSPTRGCYWNKCAFCDYGLSFGTPTSPWRLRKLELVIEDLKAACSAAPFVYFSVDVLAPAGLLQMAQAVVDAGIKVRWAAEIRLERSFKAEQCRTLASSGCVAVSVGFESGSQRILDRINKGTTIQQMESTLGAFHNAGIAVQMMGFTGFPGETFEEAMESVGFLERTRPHWTVAVLDGFDLTRGAIIAQRPAEFGVANIRARPGDDIRGLLTFEETGGAAKTAEQLKEMNLAKRRLSSGEFSRPFAGGIDSPHSIFYYARYGTRFPEAVRTEAHEKAVLNAGRRPLSRNGTLLAGENYELVFLFDADQLAEFCRRMAGADNARLSAGLAELLKRPEPSLFPARNVGDYLVRSDGEVIPCSPELAAILKAADGRRTLAEIQGHVAASFPEMAPFVERLLDYAIKWEFLISR